MSQRKLKARFTLQQIDQYASHEEGACQANCRFTAVTSQSEDCKSWSKYTPSGELTMTITNPAALEMLAVGKDYYLDITPA